MQKIILYVHGKGGSSQEVNRFAGNLKGFDVLGVDYDNSYLPQIVKPQIQEAYNMIHEKYESVYVLANSIGAYFAMLSLQGFNISKALFISPVIDMQEIILNMMKAAGVSEEDLRSRGEIATSFGETLLWEYLSFVRDNPISWDVPTEILYADGDKLISRQSIENFVKTHNAGLIIMHGGEHWFHTEEQIAFLNNWLSNILIV